jgi:hypothetical protein
MLARPLALVFAIATPLVMTAHKPAQAQPTHKCDPLDPVADAGWSVVPSLEPVGSADGAPYQAGSAGDWFIDRTTRLLPFCNYYNEIGIYSMRSYTLAPQSETERIPICHGGAPVPPYAGRCPS